MTTIKDVARKAGVSIVTVSRYLNNPRIVSVKTRHKIESAITTLNYFPNEIARSLVKKRSKVIGVIMPDIKNTFFNNWFRSVENYARQYHYNILLCNTDESTETETQYLQLLAAQRVSGILIIPTHLTSVSFLEQHQIPYLLIDRYFPEANSDYVVTDHYAGSLELTEYLIALGHRKIAVLRGDGKIFSGAERYRAFMDAMSNHGFSINPVWIRNCRFQQDYAYNQVLEVLTAPDKPTAIYSFNSLMTMGAIRAIQALGQRIPDDVSLAAFDEIPGQEVFSPKITCIVQPVEALGRNAAMFLIDKIEKPRQALPKKVLLKPTLAVGKSCKLLRSK